MIPLDRRTLSLRALGELLDRLESQDRDTPPAGRWTAFVLPGASLAQVAGDATAGLPEDVADAVDRSGTGAAVFWSAAGEGCAVLPPFPPEGRGLRPGWDTAPLRSVMSRKYRLGVVLLRLEGYAVGVFHGDRLLGSRTGHRWIHGRNRKGGQSQRRFERTREKHIQELFDDACKSAQDKFTPYAADLDYLVLGGDRHTLQAFLKGCRFLDRYGPRTLGRILPVVEPKRATLERLPAVLWQSQVFTWTGQTPQAEGGNR